MPSLTLTLPYPPSLNKMYRAYINKGKPGSKLSKVGRLYYEELPLIAAGQVPPSMDYYCNGRLAVTIHAHAPDYRRRDLDNLCKAILDGLSKKCLGVYKDDSQIDDLRIVRLEKVKGGKVVVIITELEGGSDG